MLYITTKAGFLDECPEEVYNALMPGLRNSDYGNYIIGDGDQKFLDIRNIDEAITKDVINIYLAKYETNQKQAQKKKNVDQWYDILKKEAKHFVPVNSVLVPRATRRFASTYITNKPTYLSTNFVCIKTANNREAKILSSWMSSIFYQLQLEIYCKNQGGMRKLEIENIKKTFVPMVSLMSEEDIEQILNTEIIDFYDLKKPNIREIDKIWAKVIIQNDDIEGILDNALRYLTIMAKNRES